MQKLYRRIPYLLTIAILATIAVQLYSGYIDFQKNSSNFKREMQQSLDVALDNYFIKVSEQKNITLIVPTDSLERPSNLSIEKKVMGAISMKGEPKNISVFKDDKIHESLSSTANVKMINISINKDSINFKKLKVFLDNELDRKEYTIPYTLNYYKQDTLFATSHRGAIFSKHLSTKGKSTYLKKGEKIEMLFPNAVKVILKKSLINIILSFLLVIIILFALFYLLYIVKQQKQLSEIKNDLISNISHEFKTPIAIIGTALESIRYFNDSNDLEKTNRYLDYSNQQLGKLEKMVNQLMDTAFLDTNDWNLNRQTINIKEWIAPIVENYKLNSEKEIVMEVSKVIQNQTFIDPFHLGNALGCLLDNAIRYGGNQIEILVENTQEFTLAVSDNGNSLNKEQRAKVFDKFYRVPHGNLHEVKGYGVGLYHVKKIAEKHHGMAKVFFKDNKTTFIISIPNE
ncbi:HAMP domain-containing sensor histidine kinase [Xanthomarina sp. F1114]|uniref:sensor histidine kinase n=1 Tax=Xanthomarina sp. F1114 TaxID=2996019 RepID=UPI00225E1B5E|nr:HAMP domain-containing sensor histidine kinase [Xanthomarina sp. F1114]MCX7547552.1 HAMP domain-containing sensor histidine kinase [Xanthomarina sp. F1114]